MGQMITVYEPELLLQVFDRWNAVYQAKHIICISVLRNELRKKRRNGNIDAVTCGQGKTNNHRNTLPSLTQEMVTAVKEGVRSYIRQYSDNARKILAATQ